MLEEARIIAVREIAMRAVEDMPDNELRVRAFEVILGRLLDAEVASSRGMSSAENLGPKAGKIPGRQRLRVSAIEIQSRARKGSFLCATTDSLRVPELWRNSQRVTSARLDISGYEFERPDAKAGAKARA